MKAIKILLKVVVVIIALVVVALLALPLWFGPVAKTAANSAVPGIVKADFHLGHLHLNPYTARFELGDMQLSNPVGYSEKYAVTLGEITFDAETLSLMTDVIHIEEITVKDVFASVVRGGENNVDNYVQIQYNVAGGKEKYEAAQAEKEEKADAEPQAAEAEKPAKKVIIDKLHISGLKVQYGFMPIAIPVTIELKDIGRKSGGATLDEAAQQIWEGILKAAGIAGEQLQAFGAMTGDAAKQATEAATKAAAQATEAATKAAAQATEAASKATETATKAVGNVAGQATESVGKAASAVTDTAAGATKAAGDAVNKATEGASKALDSLKKLW